MAAQLEEMPPIARLSDRVVRVLGQNPGKFTLQGTNTYIIGTSNPYILIDTAEGRDEYLPILESALRELAPHTDAGEPHISDIVLSHWHYDHVNGLPGVLALLRRMWDERAGAGAGAGAWRPPRVHKFPHALPHTSRHPLPASLSAFPAGLYAPADADAPLHLLSDGQTLAAPGATLRVLHTPGHTDDSVALAVPEDAALYTADTVLGHGTAVFEDLHAYMASLSAMHTEAMAHTQTKLYPGHGPVVQDGAGTIATYITHRTKREEEILVVLRSPPSATEGEGAGSGGWSLWSLVGRIYAAYPRELWEPAAGSLQLHLDKLQKEGRVRRVSGEGKEGVWEVVEARL